MPLSLGWITRPGSALGQATCSPGEAMRKETRPPMATGTVHWFNATRRFDDIAELTEDQRANFEIARGPKELQDSTVHHA